MTPSPEVIAVLGTFAVLAFVLALWAPAYSRARLIGRRLSSITAEDSLASDRGGQRAAAGPRIAARHEDSPVGWLYAALAQANVEATAAEVLFASGLLAVVAGAGTFLLAADAVIATASAVAAAMLPFIWIAWERRRRRSRFVQQLPDTVQLLASLVRGGNTFLQTLEHVSRESAEPTRSALAVVVREIGLGASQESALERLAQRYPSDDLTLLVAAVNVHQQIGGSLSAVLDQIADTLRERVRIHGEIKTLTAAQRLSAYVLAGLPVVVAIGRAITDPETFQLFFTVDYLRVAIIVAAGMVVAGSYAMRRIASIDV